MQISSIEINQDILVLILKKLPLIPLNRVFLVCKDLMEISSQDRVWNQWQCDLKKTEKVKVREFIVSHIRLKLNPLLERIKIIPDKLPKSTSAITSANLSDNKIWQNQAQNDYFMAYLSTDISVIDDSNKVHALHVLTIAAINQVILFSRTGLTHLEQAENLARKTKETFLNSEPFRLLTSAYTESENLIKAMEMKQIVDNLERPLQTVRGIGDSF